MQFGYFGSLYFAGLVTGSLIFPRLGDIYGRKSIAVLGNFAHIATGASILLTRSFSLALAMNFSMGFFLAARQFVGYAWLAENLCTTDMPWATVIIFGGDALTLFVTSFYFEHISKDWSLIYGIPLIFHCI